MNTFTIDTDKSYPVCYKVNDAKTLKTLHIIFKHKIYAYLLVIMYIADLLF